MPAIWSLRAPIAFITPIWRVCWARMRRHGVDDEEPRHDERQGADDAEDEEEALQQVVRGVLAGHRHVAPVHGDPASFETGTDVLDERADAVTVKGRVGGADAELVVLVAEAQVLEGVRRDVAEHPADIERGRRADLVVDAGDLQLVDLAVGGLDGDLLARRQVLQHQRTPLDLDLALPGRPRTAAGFGRHEVQALIAEVRDGGELELAVRVRAGDEADRDAPATLGIGDALVAADAIDEVGVERLREELGAGRLRVRVALGEVHLEERVGAGDRADGEHADRDRQDHERAAQLVGAEVADDLAPADATHPGRDAAGGGAGRARGRPSRSRWPARRRAPRRGRARRRGCGRPPCGRCGGYAPQARHRGSP